jgi:Zn-dependent protease with chaperone function
LDFFTRQERSRRTTRLLVGAFLLSFAAIVIATTVTAAVVLRLYSGYGPSTGGGSVVEWVSARAGLLAIVACGTLAFMLLASLYRTASLARGGGQVARLLGASEITDPTDLLRKRLLNVVEEMSIAAGLPVPEVYVLEQENGINAFAAGLTPSDAAIAVTRGALEQLDRAELQGVVAHEISHIVNGDMRLNQQLIGLSFGILVLSLIGRWLLRAARFGRRGRNSGGTAAAIGLGAALSLIGAIGLLASRLIKAGVSRQRELLADASAVQFTRESSALASALKKIGGHTSRFTSVDSEEVAHMLFERGSRAFTGWFATHPPLIERIRLLDPSFDAADFPAPATAGLDAGAAHERMSEPAGRVARIAAEAVAPPAAAGPPVDMPPADGSADAAAELLEHAGDIESPALAAGLRAAMPEELYHAAHSRDSVWLLVLALALSPDDPPRTQQLAVLDTRLGPLRTRRCASLRAELERLDPRLRIPLLELAMPALKQRPTEQIDFLVDLVERLTRLDGEPRLADYVLLRMLAAYLSDLPESRPMRMPRGRASARDALAALLAAVAAYGHDRSGDALAAYRAGLAALGADAAPPHEPDFESAELKDFSKLDAALARLKRLPPRGKRTVLQAVLATIRHDRRVEIGEIELFRAIAASLGCPIPPTAGIAPTMRCGSRG